MLDRQGLRPAYGFGFGLSYTRFEYGPVVTRIDEGEIFLSCEITNTGPRRGAEVAQLYVGFEASSLDRPKKLLRGFRRLLLDPGRTGKAQFRLRPSDLAYYDETTAGSRVEDITYKAWIVGAAELTANTQAVDVTLPG